ncbi:MAG: hypothetical protein JKY93_01690 [Gammaproteobacteria bacterium]|nr:hypothetical protein [Gammaproteobacteria bacterium]
MSQLFTIVRDNDVWASPPIPVDKGIPYTPPANTLMALTATFHNSNNAYNAAAHAALLADNWIENYDTGALTTARTYVFSKLMGASPAPFTADISNDDATKGIAFTLMEISGNATALSVPVVQTSSDTFPQSYSLTLPAFETNANSTYAIVTGGGDLPLGAFTGASSAMAIIDHIFNSGASGSSNQHYIAQNSEINTLTYQESDAAPITSVIAFEVIGELAGTPILSVPTKSGQSVAGVTLGATTNEATGTAFFVVAATAADLVGITVQQIKDGLDAQGDAAILAGSVAVGVSPFTKELLGTLSLSTNYVFAIVQNANAQDSNIITGAFATAGAVNYGFRLPLFSAPSIPAPDDSGLTAAIYSDRSLDTKLGVDYSSAEIANGICEVPNAQFGSSSALGDTVFMLLYRTAPATKTDNRAGVFELICVDLDTADNSLLGVV